MNTPRDHEERGARAAGVESLWQQKYTAATEGGAGKRAALAIANNDVAKQLRLSVTRVQQLRKIYREDVEPLLRSWQEMTEAARPGAEVFALELDIARKLLTPDGFEQLQSTRGREILSCLIDGALAQRRVVELEAEVKRLNTKLAAAEATSAYSAKPNPRR